MRSTRLNRSFSAYLVLVLSAALLIQLATARLAFAADSSRGPSSPVLVELFTSEGCSSCPPADALLEKLDGLQPVPGVQAIVLSEHVDYWNHEGWKDAYSSSFFTERQGNYVRNLRAREAYTPQIVVDGAVQMNGSDVRAVTGALETARSHARIGVRMSSLSVDGKSLRLHIATDALPPTAKARKADVFVAVALNHAQSHVSAGENKGRDIHHVAVVESINKVGAVEMGKNFDRDVVVKLKSAPDLNNLRLVAFVQESDAGNVVGATLMSVPAKVGMRAPDPFALSAKAQGTLDPSR